MNLPETPLRVVITCQGAIELDRKTAPTADVVLRTERTLLLYVTTDSKRGIVAGWTSGPPGLFLAASKETLDVKPGTLRQDWTTIEFPDLGPEWRVFATEYSKHTISVCLLREEESQ